MKSEEIKAKVDAVSPSVFMTSKAEIMDYYQDKYGQGWESQAARDLSGETSGKAYKNARRNFEARKGERVGKKGGATKKWADFGKTLPPIGKKPAKGYKAKGTVSIKISEKWFKRSLGNGWTIQDPTHFFVDPDEVDIVSAYMQDDMDIVEDWAVDSLDVEAIEE